MLASDETKLKFDKIEIIRCRFWQINLEIALSYRLECWNQMASKVTFTCKNPRRGSKSVKNKTKHLNLSQIKSGKTAQKINKNKSVI